MKPKNFPERKNRRRRRAILRTTDEAIIENTTRNIIPDARSVRTKKARNK